MRRSTLRGGCSLSAPPCMSWFTFAGEVRLMEQVDRFTRYQRKWES
jgi:hypothetical protein